MYRLCKPILLSHRLFKSALGSCNKPPIILMHGLLEDKEVWKNIPQLLADATRRQVYTFDARNHGESEHTVDLNFKDNANDLYAFLKKMKIEKSVLVGHNMGGMTAIKAALYLEQKIETAFIVDMHVEDMPPERIRYYDEYMTTCVRNLNISPAKFSSDNFAIVRYPPPEEKLRNMIFLKKAVWTFRYLNLLEALRKHTNPPEPPLFSKFHLYGKFDDPIYFIYGSDSKYFVENRINSIKENIFSYFPEAKFHTFPGPTSREVFEAPEKFVSYIAQKISPPEEEI